MSIVIVSLTENGRKIAEKLSGLLGRSDDDTDKKIILYHRPAEGIASVSRIHFEQKDTLVYVCAMGIAVRSIAPLVKDKLTDPPVLVIDEKGAFVIPILSGHMGGANELALQVAELLEAIPVITTATDINNTFAADLFAKERNLGIVNRKGIARVAVKSLENRCVTLSIKDYPPKESVDIIVTDCLDNAPEIDACKNEDTLILTKRRFVVGMGCKKGKSAEEIEEFFSKIIAKNNILPQQVYAIASIDIKADEEGLRTLAYKLGCPFITADAAVLSKVEGDFEGSDFVREKTGVDNVCERAAMLVAGEGAKLVVRKVSEAGMTLAVAKKNRVGFF